ncbi:MAG: S-layer homology domain-containing protein, partial [Chloroflexia bacterium]
GATFPISLAAGTPNDGNQSITVPNNSTTTARVQIMCSNNVFLDISNADFTILGGATPTPTTAPTNTTEPTGTGTTVPTTTPTNEPGITPSPTVCAISFTDVPVGSTFYPYIICMACRGIINGYDSGCETGNPCFRPANNVTRGQLAKIVSNASGFSEPATTQQYEDVPIGSTFYTYIWRLTIRGYVSGYPCGGQGEPCGAGSRPYFRPGATATRGQISKIVVVSAGLPIDTTGGPHFSDVANGSTFYDWIETLFNAGAVQGYPDGTFRPGNNATRGQTSKIVSGVFYPSCNQP